VTHSIEEAAILGKNILVLTDPPNSKLYILDNPGAGKADFRESEEYLLISRHLRNMLERDHLG
jgi:NitT/TauT family transport system ATP-binding protein